MLTQSAVVALLNAMVLIPTERKTRMEMRVNFSLACQLVNCSQQQQQQQRSQSGASPASRASRSGSIRARRAESLGAGSDRASLGVIQKGGGTHESDIFLRLRDMATMAADKYSDWDNESSLSEEQWEHVHTLLRQIDIFEEAAYQDEDEEEHRLESLPDTHPEKLELVAMQLFRELRLAEQESPEPGNSTAALVDLLTTWRLDLITSGQLPASVFSVSCFVLA